MLYLNVPFVCLNYVFSTFASSLEVIDASL